MGLLTQQVVSRKYLVFHLIFFFFLPRRGCFFFFNVRFLGERHEFSSSLGCRNMALCQKPPPRNLITLRPSNCECACCSKRVWGL